MALRGASRARTNAGFAGVLHGYGLIGGHLYQRAKDAIRRSAPSARVGHATNGNTTRVTPAQFYLHFTGEYADNATVWRLFAFGNCSAL